jgi:hypothetical protein
MTQEIQNSAQQEQSKEETNLEDMNNKQTEQVDPDFSTMSLKEILHYFQEMLERGNQQELYKFADTIKAAFYKTLKKEKISAGIVYPPEDSGEDTVDVVSENPFAEIERAFKGLYGKYKEVRSHYVQEMERQKEENLELKRKVIEEFKELLEKQEDLHYTFPAFRELQGRWRSIGPVPPAQNKNLWETYQFLVEKFYDYVKINNELRDLDFKKNLELKTELCEKAESLLEESNVVTAFHQLQKYHDEWRELGPVAKELREEIWDRFKKATSEINRRQQAYFEGLKEQHQKNFELKSALCEKAEEIAEKDEEGMDWNALSKEMISLQKEWKTIGYASKKNNQKVYKRFRAACDKFYDRKRDFYSDFKKEMQENLDKKIEFCEKAEELQDSTDWKKTTDQLISLQKRWKETGPVPRRESDAVWKRFRAACDHFFNAKGEYFSSIEEGYEENLQKKLALIEDIKRFGEEESSSDKLDAYKLFFDRWSEIGFVPIKEKDKVQAEFKKAMDNSFGDVNGGDSEIKLIRFKKHVKDLQNTSKGDKGLRSEREKLFQKFRKLEQDITLWENNMGFFAKSKKADKIIHDMEMKISNAKEEMAQLEEKIKLIDNQYEE